MRIGRHISAPRASVYRALLDPRTVENWKVPIAIEGAVLNYFPRNENVLNTTAPALTTPTIAWPYGYSR
jgi:hypothetical protein